MSRLLIAGTGSNSGKTTIVCAILSALCQRGHDVGAFKCGPDYIDPMFHRATGTPSHNLEPFFLDSGKLREHLARYARSFNVLEGAMGYYDGIAATSKASSYTVARVTETPVVLVVRADGAGASLGAVIRGFARYKRDSGINGVIFNNINAERYKDLSDIASRAGIPAYGYMPRIDGFSLPSRHLGLTLPHEIPGLSQELEKLGKTAERTLDIERLIALAKTAPPLSHQTDKQVQPISQKRGKSSAPGKPKPRLAISKDQAFCFLYGENTDLLERLGCELVYFSPIDDKVLPPNISGLYLCGGYPELHAKALSENRTMLKSIHNAIADGIPTVAECGGFMYLHSSIDDYPMAGVIAGRAYKTERLQRFGYITLTADRDNLLCKAGETIPSREFHYWESDTPGDGFTARKAGRDKSYSCVNVTDSLYAGFPHLYFPANTVFAENFVKRMTEYGTR